MDLHVHLTPTFTIDQVMEISKKTGVQFGIMVNPGGAVNDDAGLRRFIDSLKPYPVYYGLQPMSPGWSRSFSPETIKLLDYVLMDPRPFPMAMGTERRCASGISTHMLMTHRSSWRPT